MKTLEDVLEEITPTPDPDFVADMEWRMRHGFPPPRKRRLPRPRFLSLRPAMAVAASMLLAVLVGVSLVGGGGDEQSTGPAPVADEVAPAEGFNMGRAETTSGGAVEPALAPDTAVVDPAFPSPDGGGGIAPGTDVRRIERTAQLSLAADPDDFDALAGAIFRTADRRDGFVLQSSFSQGEDGFSGGFFELRIPASQLQPALNELSRLATVRARSESGTDITGSFVSIRDRLRTAKALRTSLLSRLEVATTDTAANALRRRLVIVGNRITALRRDLRGVLERTEYATVFVELVDEDAGAATGETDEAIDDAVASLEDVLNFLIRVVGVLVPIALAVGIGWFAVARLRRRARERALA